MKRPVIIIIFLWFASASFQTGSQAWPSIPLQTIDNQPFDWKQTANARAIVYLFLLPDCPACQLYSKTLKELYVHFHEKKIFFCGIFPGSFSNKEEMMSYQKDYSIPFPLLTDPEMKLAKKLQAHIAPEVVVADNAGRILYQGRIDDLFFAAGKRKPVVRHKELQDALESIVNDKPITVAKTQAIGCIIQD